MNQAQFVTLAEAAASVPSGAKIAIGGAMVMSPMAFVRELVRQKKRDLDLVVVPVGGINVDLLVGAGCARSIEFPQISMGEYGMAPNFRREVESGRIVTHEHSWPGILAGLQAGASGLPFHPMLGFAGTDYEKVREDFRTVKDPYSGNEIFVVPAIRPDWAVIHAIRADEMGNVICSALESDRLAILAAKRSIVTVEEVVPPEKLVARPGEIFLSALHIDLVVAAPRGAHPAGCVHVYGIDHTHVEEYLAAAKTPEGFSEYLARFVHGKTEEEYLRLACGKAVWRAMGLALEGCLPEEYLAFQVSLEVRDFERTAVGTLSPVPLLGVLHARARHAGHGKFLFFGSEDTPVTDGSRELFDLAQRGKLDLFFLSGAQVDRKGNINLTCIGEYASPRVRLPGGAGSAMLYYMTRRVVLVTLAHSPRVFVDKCDFITSAASTPHYPWRRGGPTKLITPLCTMEYDGDAAEWRLASLHHGVSGDEVRKQTGFPLMPEKVPETPSPSPSDLALMRAQIPLLRRSYPVFADELSRKIG